MNLILLQPADLDDTGRTLLSDHRARHLISVLKVKPGSEVRVGRLEGPLGTGTVEHGTDHTVQLACVFQADVPPRPRVDVLLALPRPKVMKRLWAQLAALGVDHLILTNAARVERNYFDTHVIDPAFYTPLLIEGLQQARDTRLPRVSIHRQFKPLMEDDLSLLSNPDETPLRLLADPGFRPDPVPTARGGRALLAIGPEGGWVPFERDLLTRHGFLPFSLGPRSLRTDTACIAALAVVHQTLLTDG